MKAGRFYDLAVKAIAVLFILVGVTILGLTIANGGGPLSTGFLIGVAFVGLGAARFRLQSRIGKDR
ncbi:MAG: hypothetical protein M3Y45_06395 [Actinomycetota bacterium]|nr:hypothetical protein [Actinomycetota bacterium]